jgi:hypothetical protein
LSSCVELGRLGDVRFAFERGIQALRPRHVPFLDSRRVFGAIENGERGAQLNGRGDRVVLEEAAQARKGEGLELAHLVDEAFVSITADLFDSLFEVRIALEPIVDRRAVDADGVGGGGNGAAIGEGESSLGLGGGESAEWARIRASRDNGSRKSGHREASTTIVDRGFGARGCGRRQVIEKAEKILFGGW